MVIRGGGGRELEKKVMDMGSDRSKPLHNFTMPPCLKWGNQRVLKCMKVENQNGEVAVVDRKGSALELEKGPFPRRRESERWIERTDRKATLKKSSSGVGAFSRKSNGDNDGDDGIDAFREKLITDLQTEAERIKVPALRDGLQMKLPPPPPPPPAPSETEAVRPWNLRSKRGAPRGANGVTDTTVIGPTGGNGGAARIPKVDERKPNFSPSRTGSKSPDSRGDAAGLERAPINDKRKRAEFSVSLSRQEIEEDFMRMAGRKPHRRPKKKPRVVQKQLDTLFPGLWLSEITADLYKVPDETETGKQ